MTQKLVVGPLNRGLRNDVTPFNVDNESFPLLINAYQWRDRVKRKRGTSLLGRLNRYFDSNDPEFNPGTATQVLDGSGNGNLLTGFSGSGIQTNASIVPGTVTIVDTTAVVTYTDPFMNGTLSPSGTINYASGLITIAAAAGHTIRARFKYYPDLVVLGLEPFVQDASSFPQEIGFDTTYSYNISLASPYPIHSVSFYDNLATGTYADYVQKTAWTPVNWNLADYQQVWTTNYQNAMWTVPGIPDPFSTTHIGMQFKPITNVTVVAAGPPAKATLTITGHGLTVGDFVFVNEVLTTTGINMQTGFVVTVTDANNVIVEFPTSTIANAGTGGIAQYLTRSADSTKDCIRWYNGSPVSSSIPPIFSTGAGWVNFCPPLVSGPNNIFTIDDTPPSQYYLAGARLVVPFKDRLLFFGPVIQTSSGTPIYLQDTVIYSQNGTTYYTCTFPYATVTPVITGTTQFFPVLVPTNQTATASAFFEDILGYGGNITAGYARPIITVSPNEDALIVGFADRQARLLYTSSDIFPFNFFIINSELGSDATFSSITLDRGVLSVGGRGIIQTSQVSSQRIDLEIPDQVFEISLVNSGSRRVCAQRDFINEWVYFTYPFYQFGYKFPTRTLQYNYRDGSWAIFNECYTTYGTVRPQTGYTWATIGNFYSSWSAWNTPWGEGDDTNLLQPKVIGGNQQGFVLFRDEGTGEGTSLYIKSISGSTITSPDHCLNEGDYILITGALGTIGTDVNGRVFSVANTTQNTFVLNPTIGTGTYLGGGLITRMYVPRMQTRQFPVSWDMARKTRLGPQMYLMTTTASSQVTLLIYLSQNASSPYNAGPLVPDPNTDNSSLIYSTVLYTCPESSNIGLTSANTNLQMITGSQQAQIWHRINTSLLGDTVQVEITMNDTQMRDTRLLNQFTEVELHSIIFSISPSQLLA